jgi:hypothetical protein
MKKLNFTILSILLIVIGNLRVQAQRNHPDSLLSEKDFNELIYKKFSQLLTGDSKNQIGDFASVDLGKPALNLNISGAHAQKIIYSGTLTAGLEEGLSSIFSNSSLNSNVSIGGKVHFLAPKGREVTFNLSDINNPQRQIVGFKMHWLSVGYRLVNRAFKLFTPTLSLNDQIISDHYIGHEATLEYNIYRYNKLRNHSYYFRAGLDIFLNNNLNDLKKIDLEERHEYGSTAGERTGIKKYSVYQNINDYKKNLTGLKVYLDYYKFFLENNSLAVHLYPQVTLKENSPAVYDTGVGLLFGVKNKEDNGKSILNIELYYTLLDLSNIQRSSESFFNRNEIGLRFSLPIFFIK